MSLVLRPQKGPQEKFLSTSANICIYGGAAGGGKTYALLMNPLRYKNIRGYNCTIFRRNFNQIFSQGGLWDEAENMYSGIAHSIKRSSRNSWFFADDKGRINGKVKFDYIDRDDSLEKYQGSQITAIMFDELTHFTEKQFFYMLSRNRSVCGVKPYVRATCNPDADSWVAKFIEWWIDQETGYAIPERSGKLRWMLRRGDVIHWRENKEDFYDEFELQTKEEREEPKSVTFIASTVYDNKILLERDPSYLANLKAMATVERERLLQGNWKIKPAAGLFFIRSQVTMVDTIPTKDLEFVCRAWDLAATESDKNGDPDYTAGVLMGIKKDHSFIVLDVIKQRIKAGDVEKLIYNTALIDRNKYGYHCRIRIPQDPGAAGKIVSTTYIKKLAGFNVKAIPVSGSKQLRATPFAAQWQQGNVSVLLANWNDDYFSQLESFPESKHDDMVDASSDAFNELAAPYFDLKNLIN